MLVRFVQSFIVWKSITVNSGENPDVEVECISAMTFFPSWSGLCNIFSKALVASGAHSEIGNQYKFNSTRKFKLREREREKKSVKIRRFCIGTYRQD